VRQMRCVRVMCISGLSPVRPVPSPSRSVYRVEIKATDLGRPSSSLASASTSWWGSILRGARGSEEELLFEADPIPRCHPLYPALRPAAFWEITRSRSSRWCSRGRSTSRRTPGPRSRPLPRTRQSACSPMDVNGAPAFAHVLVSWRGPLLLQRVTPAPVVSICAHCAVAALLVPLPGS
jgi:hypothetical protein